MENVTQNSYAGDENNYLNASKNSTRSLFQLPNQLTYVYVGTGILGMVANGTVLACIAWSKKINSCLKVYILSLVLNDMMFMLGLCVLGATHGRGGAGTSDHPACWFGMFIVLSTVLQSYVIISQISFFNYLAVFCPLKIKLWTTKRKFILLSVLLVVGTSVIIFGSSAALLGFDFPREQPCMPYLLAPRRSLINSSVVSILCASVVLILNSKTVTKIKNMSTFRGKRLKNRTPKAFSVSDNSNTVGKSSKPKVETETGCTETSAHGNVDKSKKDSSVFTVTTSEHIPDNILAPHQLANEHVPTSSALPHPEFIPSKNVDSNLRIKVRKSSLDSELSDGKFQPGVILTKDISSPSRRFSSASGNEFAAICSVEKLHGAHIVMDSLQIRRHASSQAEISVNIRCPQLNTARQATSMASQIPESKGNSLIASAGQTRQRAFRKTSITLSILTLWCCLFTLPFVIFTLFVATLTGGKEEAVQSPIATFFILTIVINALSNPVLYAWRLVDWSHVRARLGNRHPRK